MSVVYKNTSTNTTGVLGPLAVQFPRAADYHYYLYWTTSGELVLVNQDRMQELPADPDDNYPPVDPPSSANAHTLVVINVTPNQPVDVVEFEKIGANPSIHLLQNKPRAKDQARILLGTGSYDTRAYYTKNSVSQETDVKTTIITGESGSMAAMTNYLYFYKTKSGSYDLSPFWPPIPNDAADDNDLEDALTDTQGILQITNGANPALPDDIIARISIGGAEYSSSSGNPNDAYMLPNDVERFIVEAGPSVPVAFMAKREDPADMEWGMTLSRNIKPKEINYLEYTNNLAKPDTLPPDTDGFGRGIIRITNNSSGAVTSVYIYDRGDVSKLIPIGYEGFTPPKIINGGQMGRVLVVGDADFPLEEGETQLIQIFVETADTLRVVERVAGLRNTIVNIVITQTDLDNSKLPGSQVTVRNQTSTSTTITGLMVFNTKNPAVSMVYNNLNVLSGGNKAFNVLSSPGFPILDGETYRATLTVQGNGHTALITKDFTPNGKLYSLPPSYQTREIALIESDLPPAMTTFEPIASFAFTSGTLSVNSSAQRDEGNSNYVTLTSGGHLNLHSYLGISPSTASKQGPIEWELLTGGNANGAVTLDPDTGLLEVTGYSTASPPYVEVKATIREAKGSNSSKTDATATVRVNLTYTVTSKPYSVTGFTLTNVSTGTGGSLNLLSRVSGWTPSYANNGVSYITSSDLDWTIEGSALGSSISGSTFYAGTTAGPVTIKATLPGNRNNSSAPLTRTATITIEAVGPPFVNVSDITLNNGSTAELRYYTVTNPSNVRTLQTPPSVPLNLTALVTVNPSNATKTSPVEWAVVSGGTAQDTSVQFSSPDYQMSINPSNIPTNGQTVKVRPTIRNAASDGTTDVVGPAVVTVTLREINSRPVVFGELTVTGKTITVGETFNMNVQASLPANASAEDVTITKDDLTWTFVSGSGGTINASGSVTGTAVGTFTVRATLPSAKNAGQGDVWAEAVVNVTAKPHPDYLTLRVIHTNNKSDKLTYVALLPIQASYSQAVRNSGYTGVQFTGSQDPSFLSVFKKWFPTATYYSTSNLYSEWTYVDITIPWPSAPNTGYYLWFVEGDNRVRGYSVTGKVAPPKSDNYYFYLDAETVQHFVIPMVGLYETTAANAAGRMVLPIGYDTHANFSRILKSRGVGVVPWAY
jgi:hypothetical protein